MSNNSVLQGSRGGGRWLVSFTGLLAVLGWAVNAETVNLAWDANSDSVTAGYYLYTEGSNGQIVNRQDVGMATTASALNLTVASSYVFYVTAYNASRQESAPSNRLPYQTASKPNAAPVANAVNVQTLQGQPASVVLTGSDPEGRTLTFAIITTPGHGTLSGTTPNLTYTPAANYSGQDSFTYRVNDGTLNSAAATVLITISPAVNPPPSNLAPIANAFSVSTGEGRPVSFSLLGSDPNGDALTYSILSNPAHGTLSGIAFVGGALGLTYTPAAGFSGNDSFAYRVTDESSLFSPSATVTISVTRANRLPVANTLSFQTYQNQSVGLPISGSDPDGDGLSFQIVQLPAHGSLSGTAPNLTYTPSPGYTGADVVQFKVNDGKADSATATASISIVSSGGRIKLRRFSYAAQ